jgi:hypothetical protein
MEDPFDLGIFGIMERTEWSRGENWSVTCELLKVKKIMRRCEKRLTKSQWYVVTLAL